MIFSRPLLLIYALACTCAHAQSLPAGASGASIPPEPLIPADHIVTPREPMTVSARDETLDFKQSGDRSGEGQTLAGLEAELEAVNLSADSARHRQRLQAIALLSAIEFLLTLLALNIAFQLSGLSPGQGPLLLLSLAVGLLGALLNTLLQAAPLHPIQAAAGFALLFALLRPLTPVHSWAGALKIAATVRLTSTLCLWLGHQGLAGLLRI